MNKTVKFIINTICNLLIITLLILIIYLGYTRIVIKDPAYLIKDYYFYKVISGSMEPTLQIGDYILIKESANYKEGDIITYKEKNKYITHRIIKIDGDNITAKGDFNNTEDKIIKKVDIKGKYIKKINTFGKVYEKITNKETLTITILFLLLVRIGISVLSKN